ncbi:hypothetical protein ONS95_005787 [Cadophora gregata]|uniref:uncharacterized protein n=1 Tax=Cadophora gregata TaxID=51156 RepID=UPI0026DABAD9|nr:uncharacterized protein ONS95_005787 [Cadophora gregata]KAK0103785.1 hypothetical protein ONS95_005787 [Cadophora gregata]
MRRRNSAPAQLPAKHGGHDADGLEAENSEDTIRPHPGGLQPDVVLPRDGLREDGMDRSTVSDLTQESPLLRGPYQYQPLQAEAREIRLMTLLPGSIESDIRITLKPVTFTNESVVSFEALSYTWGSAESPVDIFIGEFGYATLSVTRNLADALPYLRYPDKPRVLWIDAICVNQQDVDERSSQVKRMASIYSHATRVLIWLGPQSTDSDIAIDSLERIASKYHVNWMTWEIEPIDKDGSWWATPEEMLPLSDVQFWSILNLISRDWFERLWILQEAHLANKDALVVCGKDTMLWNSVRKAMFCIRKKPYPSYIYAEFSERLGHILGVFLEKDVYRFCALIDDTRFCKYTDPRDRVYGILGLLDEKHQLGIEPDYTKTVCEVYKDAAWKHVESTDTLEILCKVEFHNTEGLPSWAPDLRKPRKAIPFSLCNTSGHSLADHCDGPDGLLRVQGIPVSRISRIEPFNFAEFETDGLSVIPKLRLVANKLGLLDNLLTCLKAIPALCEVLCANDFTCRRLPRRDGSLDLLTTEQLLRRILGSKQDMREAYRNERFFAKVQTHCYGRALFITEDGHLGLAPEATRPGDLVTVLLGCDSAMVLRPVTSPQFPPSSPPPSSPRHQHQSQYKVIGESYTHAHMNAEAILGPLPGLFDAIKAYTPNRGFTTQYLDRETGEIVAEDPRLGELPGVWKRAGFAGDPDGAKGEGEGEGEGDVPMYVNGETGRRTGNDPRMGAGWLLGRGVGLEVFDLV